MMRLHKRLTSWLWVAALAITVAVTASVYAQSSQPQQNQPQQGQNQQPAGEQQSQTEPATDDATAQQTPEPLPDIDSQPIEPGVRANGRFIPSEQISQDLGVSFPVDI
jgi:uncharacterized iron-regulated membrane protein